MAKKKVTLSSSEGIQVGEKPKPDIYLALLMVTFLAMTVAVAIMWIERSSLSV